LDPHYVLESKAAGTAKNGAKIAASSSTTSSVGT